MAQIKSATDLDTIPIPTLVRSAEFKNRFYRKVEKSPGCWIWKGARLKKGYGHLGIGDHFYLSHRVAYFMEVGDLSPDVLVLHSCDNPPCVRPDHFYVGDKSKNAKDAFARGLIITVNMTKTQCVNGHGFSVENTRYSLNASGRVRRTCRMCDRLRTRKDRENGKRKSHG